MYIYNRRATGVPGGCVCACTCASAASCVVDCCVLSEKWFTLHVVIAVQQFFLLAGDNRDQGPPLANNPPNDPHIASLDSMCRAGATGTAVLSEPEPGRRHDSFHTRTDA